VNAAIVVSPTSRYVAFLYGASVRVLDTSNNTIAKIVEEKAKAEEPVRILKFSSDEAYFLTAGDDKVVRLYETGTFKLLTSKLMTKKIVAGDFSFDGKFVVADKTGDVFALSMPDLAGDDESALIMGHLSQITNLAVAKSDIVPGGGVIVTCDMDERVRVSRYPKAYVIESFLLGHASFVSSVVLVDDVEKKSQVLVSAGDEGVVYVWDLSNGRQLDSAQFVKEGVDKGYVTSMCYDAKTQLIAVTSSSLPQVAFYQVSNHKLVLVSTVDVAASALSASFDNKSNLHLMLAGPVMTKLSYAADNKFSQDATNDTLTTLAQELKAENEKATISNLADIAQRKKDHAKRLENLKVFEAAREERRKNAKKNRKSKRKPKAQEGDEEEQAEEEEELEEDE